MGMFGARGQPCRGGAQRGSDRWMQDQAHCQARRGKPWSEPSWPGPSVGPTAPQLCDAWRYRCVAVSLSVPHSN